MFVLNKWLLCLVIFCNQKFCNVTAFARVFLYCVFLAPELNEETLPTLLLISKLIKVTHVNQRGGETL